MAIIVLSSKALREMRSVCVGEIATFIAMGRQHVLNGKHDPYRKERNPQVAILRDATSILRWYRKEIKRAGGPKLLDTYSKLVSIQFGPHI